MAVRKYFGSSAQPLTELRQVRVICSTAEEDRGGEYVMQDGINLSSYKANSVVLWMHDPQQPIAKALEIGVEDGVLQALVQFPPVGTSVKSDEVYGLIVAGVINATSIGFDPTMMEPVDPANPRGPQIYKACELLEFSFVSIPAVRGALVTGKSAPVHGVSRAATALVKRGLYDCGRLACLLDEMGWLTDSAAWEAEYEGDGSQIPAMLGEVMQRMGAALVAMTQEEVAELLAANATEADEAFVVEDVEEVMTSASVGVRKYFAGRASIAKAVVQPMPVIVGASRRKAVLRSRIAALG